MNWPSWCKQIVHEKPGVRFLRTYRRRRAHERGRPWLTAITAGTAVIMLCVGGLFMVLPVLPGFVFVLPGLAVLVGGSRRGALWLDRTELWTRRNLTRLRGVRC